MAGRSGSFVRNSGGISQATGVKLGPNGTSLVSTGFSDLDKIIGGGIPVGGILMVMEDLESPHHLLLLRYFMAQGLVHDQSLLFASPLSSPQAFLGTLPGILQPKDGPVELEAPPKQTEGEGLRIAWQYRKYMTNNSSSATGSKHDFCSSFDFRKPMERLMISKSNAECINLQQIPDISVLKERCITFLSKFTRDKGRNSEIGRIALQSLCAPQCKLIDMNWETLSFLHFLKTALRACNAVAMITFSPLLTPSFSPRWKHISDILISIKAITDEDEQLGNLLTDYKDIIGFVHIHKLASINTQVPTISETSTYSLKLLRRKYLSLERLNQAPVNPASGESYGTSGVGSLCSKSSNLSLDF